MSDEDTAKLNSSIINTEYEVLLMHNNRSFENKINQNLLVSVFTVMGDVKQKNQNLDKYSWLELLQVDHFWLLWQLEFYFFAVIDTSQLLWKDLERPTQWQQVGILSSIIFCNICLYALYSNIFAF